VGDLIQFPTSASQPIVVDTHDEPDGSMMATAVFDAKDRVYRYLLTRQWAVGTPLVFLMLNPSTADAFVLDRTVSKCIKFARREGFPAIKVLNIFALRSRHPSVLYGHADPVGPLNDEFLLKQTAGLPVLCGWGTHGAYQGRGRQVARMLEGNNRVLYCLSQTKDGHPGHPLFLRDDSPMTRYEVA
jgi:hypothetical protein